MDKDKRGCWILLTDSCSKLSKNPDKDLDLDPTKITRSNRNRIHHPSVLMQQINIIV